jgi:hypothetical protein
MYACVLYHWFCLFVLLLSLHRSRARSSMICTLCIHGSVGSLSLITTVIKRVHHTYDGVEIFQPPINFPYWLMQIITRHITSKLAWSVSWHRSPVRSPNILDDDDLIVHLVPLKSMRRTYVPWPRSPSRRVIDQKSLLINYGCLFHQELIDWLIDQQVVLVLLKQVS